MLNFQPSADCSVSVVRITSVLFYMIAMWLYLGFWLAKQSLWRRNYELWEFATGILISFPHFRNFKEHNQPVKQ